SAGPLAPPVGDWRRVGMRSGLVIRPGDPVVARFDFVPPATLAERRIALLAVAHSPGEDPLGAPPPPTVIDNVVRGERRAAPRAVGVLPLDRRAFVRDGVDDAGAVVPAVAFGARSPDIIVVQDEVDPRAQFGDLLDRHPTDRVTGSRDNFVYVRVFNPSP